jgi:hypothetical protein
MNTFAASVAVMTKEIFIFISQSERGYDQGNIHIQNIYKV